MSKLLLYPPHPVCSLTPPMDPETYAATKASIKAVGVQRDTIAWQDPKTGKIFTVDGRHRMAIVRELIENDKITHADNGVELTVPISMLPAGTTEQEVIDLVERETLCRKQLSKSQRAMSAVMLHHASYEANCKAKVPGYKSSKNSLDNPFPVDPASPDAKDKKPYDAAQLLAERYQTNRQYIIWAKNIISAKTVAKDLIVSVVDGHMSLQDAHKLLISRENPKPEATTENDQPSIKQAEKGQDMLGNKLPEDLEVAFDARAIGVRIADSLAKVIAQLGAYSANPGGSNLDVASAKALIKKVESAVTRSLPYAICTECQATGKVDGKICRKCSGCGFITEGRYVTQAKKNDSRSASAKRSKKNRDDADHDQQSSEPDLEHLDVNDSADDSTQAGDAGGDSDSNAGE